MAQPLMPKGTAVWLVENTTLTLEQIAAICGLHPLEVQGVADGEVAIGIIGFDPVGNRQLTREEIERCQADPTARPKLAKSNIPLPAQHTKGPRYTPVSKRQNKPNAVMWLLRHRRELGDVQIARLIGTTNDTIAKVRERSHWNAANLTPQDPVLLGLCTQTDLNREVDRAQKAAERAGIPQPSAPAPEPAAGAKLPGGFDISQFLPRTRQE
jgi:uncharacterized protein